MIGRRATCLVAAAVAFATALASCAGSGEAEARLRDRLLDDAASQAKDRLERGLARAGVALDGLERALERAGGDRARRFEEAEALRARANVTGLSWEGPGGEMVWAGDPFEPPEGPLPAPWQRSVASGDVVWHAGPFKRALVVRRALRAGTASATVAYRTRTQGPFEGPAEELWAALLHVGSIRVAPPAEVAGPPDPDVRRVGVRAPGAGEDVLAVVVRSLPAADLSRLAGADRRRLVGLAGLLGLAVAAAAGWVVSSRTIGSASVRAAARTGVLLLAREGLALLDLTSRFEALAPLSRVADFGLAGYGGWLANPFELLLTAAALLAAAVGLGTASDETGLPRSRRARAPLAVAGALAAGLATALWLFFVEAGATQSQVDYFAPGSLIPTRVRGTMLSALVLATAACWILVRAGLLFARRAWPELPAVALRLGAGALAAAVALALSPDDVPWWAPVLLPAVAVAIGRLAPEDPVPSTPSRILLVSVLATVLVLPLLRIGIDRAARADVAADVSELVRREEEIETALRTYLPAVAADEWLVRSLEATTAGGPPPDGLALHAWSKLPMIATGRDDAAIVVFDGRGNRVSRFLLNTPPFSMIPKQTARSDEGGDGDLSVRVGVEEPGRVRGTVARATVRGKGGRAVGTLLVVAPDPLAVELARASPRLATRPEDFGEGKRIHRVALSLVSGGRVVASTDPDLPRAGTPPVPVSSETAQPGWVRSDGDREGEWYVHPAGARGTVLARREAPGLEDDLLAIGRVSIVGVGLGAAVAFVALLVGLRRFRPRLQDKILGSYFAISVVPLLILGWANWRDALARGEEDLRRTQELRVRAARQDLEIAGREVVLESGNLALWAATRGQDLLVYQGGSLVQTSLEPLREAELIPERLPADAYRATEVEERERWVRDERIAGRDVRVVYAPLRDDRGRPFATVAVPLLHDVARVEQRAAETGSVLLAAYLLTLVLVVVIGIYTARGIARPLDLLARGAQRVGQGRLDVAIPGGGHDEVGTLVHAFNRMTAELQEARARAAQAEREAAWRGMARQVAHEIKNPLTPMKLMLQQLQATARTDPDAAARMIEPTARVVLEQIDALARIAGDFAAFARFPPREVRETDVAGLLRSVAALYAGAEGGRAEVEAGIDEGLPPVRWDADELRRVFVNLVANAVQAMDEAKGRVHVRLRAERAASPETKRDGILVRVEDDGVGIPDGDRGRLFEPDFSTKTGGTGLGLAIVKRILADLGGDIRIDTKAGEGTVVSVWLPAARAAAAAPPRPPSPEGGSERL